LFKLILATLSLGFIFATSANATPLLPGTSIAASTLTYGGTLVGFSSGAITPGTFMGVYTESVYSDPLNTYCSGCFDFVYQIANYGTTGVIEHLTGYSFDSFLTSVGFTGISGEFEPVTISRTTDGTTVDFNFLGAANVPAGGVSTYLVVQTNATAFTTGLVSLQDGSAGTAGGLVPTMVPEPSSIVLLGSGLLGIVGVVRRKLSVL
jgi:hypothetical protein